MSGNLGERLSQGFKGVFKGYSLVALMAFIIMISTAIAFGSLKINPENFKPTFLNHYFIKYSVPVYLLALYCWYLTLLDGATSGDFVNASRNAENATALAFSARLINRNDTK
jgi:hypothetical protein